MKIFVDSVPSDITEEELFTMFRRFGHVQYAMLIRIRSKGTPLRFGFVTMPHMGNARTAVAKLNGTSLRGKRLDIHEAFDGPSSRTSSPRAGRAGAVRSRIKHPRKREMARSTGHHHAR